MTDTAATLIALLRKKRWTISTVESCTSGSLASAITDAHEASFVFKQGWVVYSNEAKQALARTCGLSRRVNSTLKHYGVYSATMAQDLASLACAAGGAEIGIGVTGTLSRPDTANPGSTVGEIYVCVLTPDVLKLYTLMIPNPDWSKREKKDWVCTQILENLVRDLQTVGVSHPRV